MARTGARRRNLQEERSSETRSRLLEATIESLVAVGYARTSTTEIADRAGVSRAAWIYHYPTKAALVAAAVERLLESRLGDLPSFHESEDGEDTPAAAIELLVQSFEGPMFLAWLELVVAARTDEDLRTQMAGVSLRFAAAAIDGLRKRFPNVATNPMFEHGDFALSLVDGIFLTRILYADEERFRRMVATLVRMAELAQPAGAAPKATAPPVARPKRRSGSASATG